MTARVTTLGVLLKHLRTEAELTQEELADGSRRRTFVLADDGAPQEGSNRESAMTAVHYARNE